VRKVESSGLSTSSSLWSNSIADMRSLRRYGFLPRALSYATDTFLARQDQLNSPETMLPSNARRSQGARRNVPSQLGMMRVHKRTTSCFAIPTRSVDAAVRIRLPATPRGDLRKPDALRHRRVECLRFAPYRVGLGPANPRSFDGTDPFPCFAAQAGAAKQSRAG
jgi:hypothetical protein